MANVAVSTRNLVRDERLGLLASRPRRGDMAEHVERSTMQIRNQKLWIIRMILPFPMRAEGYQKGDFTDVIMVRKQ
jgi:hypothetical protein